MCLIVFAHKVVPGYDLVLVANRDEFLKRPTAPLDWWPENPNILAGRDLEGGGTWLGVNRGGEWTAITNFREPLPDLPNPPSRGLLTKNLLENKLTLLSGNLDLSPSAESYHGFNLLSGTKSNVGYFSNRGNSAPSFLEPGFYGLSNHLLDTPWPKVMKTKASFIEEVGQGRVSFSELFAILKDEKQTDIEELPQTGIPLEWEKILSAAYINAEERGYGTRLRTIMTISSSGEVQICEWKRGEDSPGKLFSFQRS